MLCPFIHGWSQNLGRHNHGELRAISVAVAVRLSIASSFSGPPIAFPAVQPCAHSHSHVPLCVSYCLLLDRPCVLQRPLVGVLPARRAVLHAGADDPVHRDRVALPPGKRRIRPAKLTSALLGYPLGGGVWEGEEVDVAGAEGRRG